VSDDRELEPDAWEVEAPESHRDSRHLDTTIVRRFTYVPTHERGDKEPLYSQETVRNKIKKVVQEDMNDKNNSAELIGRLMEVFGDE